MVDKGVVGEAEEVLGQAAVQGVRGDRGSEKGSHGEVDRGGEVGWEWSGEDGTIGSWLVAVRCHYKDHLGNAR